MKNFYVKAESGEYPIYINDSFKGLSEAFEKAGLFGRKACIICDTNTKKLYLDDIINAVGDNFLSVCTACFEAGEERKTLDTIYYFYKVMKENRLDRKSVVIALGGGVVGDMAGFAAATYQRGIDFIQIPTSLLAQVDSSVGAKTGVDIKQGKNLVGAFWQPSAVLIDPNTLKTLTPEFFSDGMAEVIKYGCIKSVSLFERLEKENAADIIDEIILECVSIKKDVVERDEHESGERML